MLVFLKIQLSQAWMKLSCNTFRQKWARFTYAVKLQIMHRSGAGGVENSAKALIAVYMLRCIINNDSVEFDAFRQIRRYDNNSLFIFKGADLQEFDVFDVGQGFICTLLSSADLHMIAMLL